MTLRRFAAPTAAILALTLATAGQAAAKKDGDAFPPAYLSGAAAPHPLDFLPAPPAPGSAEGVADRQVFDATRSLQDTPRWTLAQADNDLSTAGIAHAFSCALGVAIGPATPVLSRLIGRAESDALNATVDIKNRYKRPRPFAGNDAPICTPMRTSHEGAETGGGPSYPSGHATVGWTTALILAQVSPTHKDTLMRRGRSFGESRVVCGVHFVTDIEAGRTVGSAVFAALQTDLAFRNDLVLARAELAAHRAAAPDAKACAAESALTTTSPY